MSTAKGRRQSHDADPEGSGGEALDIRRAQASTDAEGYRCSDVYPRPPTRQTLLLVDDEPVVRVSLKRLLEHQGYDVLTAANGLEASQVAYEHGWRLDAVLIDLRLGIENGLDVGGIVERLAPKVQVVYMSGNVWQEGLPRGLVVLEKPLKVESLRAALDRLGSKQDDR